MKDAVKPLACSADMHEPSSKYTPTVPSGMPGELFVSHSLSTLAQLSWTPVPEDKQNNTITGYTVQVEGPDSDSKREIPVMDGNATSYEVSGLRPYTTYTFSICAMTEMGTGPAISITSTTPQGGELFMLDCTAIANSYSCTHTTAPSATPKWLTVGCNHPTSVQLSWGDVPTDQRNGIITGYSVQVEGPDTTRNIQITTPFSDRVPSILGLNLLKEVYDLRPSTEYSFSVSAVTEAGSGPAISVSFITPQKGEASAFYICVVYW